VEREGRTDALEHSLPDEGRKRARGGEGALESGQVAGAAVVGEERGTAGREAHAGISAYLRDGSMSMRLVQQREKDGDGLCVARGVGN
jgi:hypothetical protein